MVELKLVMYTNNYRLLPITVVLEATELRMSFPHDELHEHAQESYKALESLAMQLIAEGVKSEVYYCKTSQGRKVDCVRIPLKAQSTTILTT